MMLTRWLKRTSPVTSLGNLTENRHLEYQWKGNIAMFSNGRRRKDLVSYPIVSFGSSSAVCVCVCVCVCVLVCVCWCVCVGLTRSSVTDSSEWLDSCEKWNGKIFEGVVVVLG